MGMSRPRQIIPGSVYMLSRRCTQRQYLLRPEAEVNNAYLYCLGVAAQRHDIQLLLAVAEANHHHVIFRDPLGVAPQFIEYLHRLLAKCLNAFRGRWENFWSSEEPCYTRLLDLDTIIAKLVYVAANPVKDGLVERVHHWPGVVTFAALRTGKRLGAKRPRFFFDRNGTMPEAVTLTFAIPKEVGAAARIIDAVDHGVAEVERDAKAQRAATGQRVLGRAQVLGQSWRSAPSSVAPRRNLRPRFAGLTDVRIAALQAYRAFQAAYRAARAKWRAGPKGRVTFPVGTYALCLHAPITTAATAARA